MNASSTTAGLTLRVKVLGSVAAIGTAATVAGLGTFGAFTSTTSAGLPATAGTVVIALGSAGTAANRLTIGATGLVPGDTMQRAFQLSNTGNQALSAITLSTTASPSSLLDTDATNGLQLVVQSCSTPWTEAGTAPAYTYTCSGTTTTALASRAVIGSNLTLPGLSSLTAAGTDNLMATLTFPAVAGNTLQGLSSTVTFTFTGTQRAATNK
ncbi:TasA family protein [Dermatophilaceae bacterium Soc4.6]